jgi:hypothetical protein
VIFATHCFVVSQFRAEGQQAASGLHELQGAIMTQEFGMLAPPIETGSNQPGHLFAWEAVGGHVLDEIAGVAVQTQLLLVTVAQAQHLAQGLQNHQRCHTGF